MINYWEISELAKVRQQELLDEAARNRRGYQRRSDQRVGDTRRAAAAIERIARRFLQVRLVTRQST